MDVINDDTLFQKGEIDVALLHKKNKSESFLLSCIKDSENSFSARAMMQEYHYFSDHTATMSDLMYLLECARQAETYIVHQYNKQPLDIHFILSDWSGQFTSDFLPLREFSSQEIKFRVFLKSSQFIKNRLISQDYHFEFYDETIYAEFKMSVKYMTDAAYEVIRKKSIKEDTSNFFFNATEKLSSIIPESIFRKDKHNVVIRTEQCNENHCISFICVDRNNTAYFDHEQDHYPAMVLMEAGKQNCQYWIYRNTENFIPVMVYMKSNFFKYAELESAIKIISSVSLNAGDNCFEFNVSLQQKEMKLAEMKYVFSSLHKIGKKSETNK